MEKAIEQLEKVNKKLDVIIAIMKTPGNRLIRVLELAAAVAGVLSLLSIIELIRHMDRIVGGKNVFSVDCEHFAVTYQHFIVHSCPNS